MHEIGYYPQVLEEVNNAIEYYDVQSTGLGERFYAEVTSSTLIIREAPQIWPKVPNGISRYLLKHFPFGIFYSYTESLVMVVSIGNLNKKPMFWSNRLRETKI